MSYSINFDSPDGGEEVFALCNVGSWGKFKEYVDALPGEYNYFKDFVLTGESQNTNTLSDELLTAQLIDPPTEGSPAMEVLEILIELVGVGDEEEHAYISQE